MVSYNLYYNKVSTRNDDIYACHRTVQWWLLVNHVEVWSSGR